MAMTDKRKSISCSGYYLDLGSIDEMNSTLFDMFVSPTDNANGRKSSYEHCNSSYRYYDESRHYGSPGRRYQDVACDFRGGESQSAFRSVEPYQHRSRYNTSTYPNASFFTPTPSQHQPQYRYQSPEALRSSNIGGYAFGSVRPAPRLSELNVPPFDLNTAEQDANDARIYREKYYDVPGKELKNCLQSHQHQHISTIEVAPGWHLRLRGADETVNAIENDFYTSCECTCCELTVFCIQDADYVICPVCREVSPVSTNETENYGRVGGVGLGFQIEALMKCQVEIVTRRVASMNY
jgi:hypothetical protein